MRLSKKSSKTRPKPKLAAETSILSYYDVRLTTEDVKTIRSDWLTDNAISFYEEYIEREQLVHYPRSNIVLLRPSMAFMIMSIPDPASIRDAMPDFTVATHIFLPINNNPNPRVAEGGSHWSLLVISLLDNLAFHYDSLDNTNMNEAKLVTRNFERMLGDTRILRFRTMRACPQQNNNADCGVYVCLFMSHLLFQKLLNVETTEPVSMSLHSARFNAAGFRVDMVKLIKDLRLRGENLQPPGSQNKNEPPRISDETRGKIVSRPSEQWLELMDRSIKGLPTTRQAGWSSRAGTSDGGESGKSQQDGAVGIYQKSPRAGVDRSDGSDLSSGSGVDSVFSHASNDSHSSASSTSSADGSLSSTNSAAVSVDMAGSTGEWKKPKEKKMKIKRIGKLGSSSASKLARSLSKRKRNFMIPAHI